MVNKKKNQGPFNSKEEKQAFEYATQKLTLLDKKFGLDRIKARSEELFLLIIESKHISYELLQPNTDFTEKDKFQKIERIYQCVKTMEILLSDLYRESNLMEKYIDYREVN